MPNHFHLMIKIRTIEEAAANLKRPVTSVENLSGVVSQQFSNLFNAYTKAVNKVYERRGSLFQRPFKHKKVVNDAYFTQLVLYIHNNPVKHGFVRRLEDWPHNSYHQYISNFSNLSGFENLTGLNVVTDWFGSPEHFKKAHEGAANLRSVFD